MVLKGKSGWCSTICPLLPVQRIYGQTPFALVANSHCQPCVGCTKNCYDFNPKAAYLADLNDPDPYWAGYRQASSSPRSPASCSRSSRSRRRPARSAIAEMLGQLALYMAASVASFYAARARSLKVSAHKLTTLYGAVALQRSSTGTAARRSCAAVPASRRPTPATWALRAAVLALAAAWVAAHVREGARSSTREAAAGAPPRAIRRRRARSLAAHARAARRRARGDASTPTGKRVVAKPGTTLLEVAEADGLPIEAGCRMGVCGADPIAVKDGMEQPLADLRRRALDARPPRPRRQHAHGVLRARAGPGVGGARRPTSRARPALAQIRAFAYDRSIERVVVLGNGIAGVTAADHVRRRHPECADRPRRRRAAPPLQPHGHLAADLRPLGDAGALPQPGLLVRGAQHHDVAEHARARGIDRAGARRSCSAPASVLALRPADPRHRLEQRSCRAIEGFGAPGTFVLRSAEDALDIRAFAQRQRRQRAVVAGGGLLGLEAAYALHKLGLRTTVLERSRPAAAPPARRARVRVPAPLPRGPRAWRSSRSAETAALSATGA